MPLRNVATTFTIEQQRLEINNLAGDVNNIATGVTNVGTAATANALAAGATGADLTLSGTLTVNGTQTILNTATLEVEDKNIIIAKGSTTDAAASGGGITLKGADDKTLLYDQAGDEWQFNKPLRVEGSQEYTASASSLETSVTKAAFRVKGSTNSSDSLWMGVESTDANPYIQGSNGVGNLAKKLLLNPFGGNVGVGLVNPDCELHVKGAGSVARFEGTGGSSFIDLYDSDDDTRCFVGVDGGTFKVQTSANSWSDKLSVTPAGVVIVNIDNNDTDHTNNSLPAGVSGLYTRNGNGTSGTFSAVSLIASSSGAASDQSASLVAKCTGSGLSPEVYLTQRDGSNSQRNTLSINTLGDATFIGSVSDYKGDIRRVPATEPGNANYTLAATDAGKYVDSQGTGNTITVPANTFSQGDVITILRATSGDVTIAQGSGLTMYHSADGANTTTGNRVLAQRGMVTMIFVGPNYCYISGAGLS